MTAWSSWSRTVHRGLASAAPVGQYGGFVHRDAEGFVHRTSCGVGHEGHDLTEREIGIILDNIAMISARAGEVSRHPEERG